MPSSTMSFLAPPLVWQLLFVFLAFARTGWAATAECVPGWEWSDNSKKQNPCEVAGYLQGACMGYSAYELEPLDPGSLYTEPQKGDTEDLKCGCNTIIYSLYSACASCQNASTQAWSEWNQHCDSVYVTQYPFDIPGSTAVPRWAFIDVTKTDNFDETAAKDVGRDPEALGKVPVTLVRSSTSPSGKISTSDPPLSTSPTSSLSPSTLPSGSTSSAIGPLSTDGGSDSGEDTSDRKDNPAIIGGVIGGIVGFTALSLLVWLSLRHHPRKATVYAASLPFANRTLSTHRSYYPSSESPYTHEPEMDESGTQGPGIYSRVNPASLRESAHNPGSPRSITSSAESDMQTTDSFYGGGREYNARV